jgi:acetolactate synthase-1/2/3 large subunit
MQNGAQAAVRALEENGVEMVFGIPGTHTLPLYRALGASAIRHITPRHEQGGGYAADGFARASGRPGVCLVTTGPGAMNAVTPAATSYADSVPQLILSTGMPLDIEGTDAGYLHQTKNQQAALDAVTAWSRRAVSPADVQTAIHDAFDLFNRKRPRPVYVEIPIDVLAQEAPASAPPDKPRGEAQVPPASAIPEAVELLAAARKPALVLGGGARGAQAEATALAEWLEAPVITSVNGKGVVSEFHPLSLGAALRLPSARAWIAERDVVLAVGTELGESDLWGPPLKLGGKAIRVDIDPGQLTKNLDADVSLQGEADSTLRALLTALAESPRAARQTNTSLDLLQAALRREAMRDGQEWVELCAVLERVLGDEAILCGDSTMACYFGAVHFTRLSHPSRFLYPTGYATLGYALPAAIGAKLAFPDRPVVALVGDGGLMFTVAELVTASELRLGLPVIVVNNGGYGEIKRQMLEENIPLVAVDLYTFRLLARSLGAHACRIETAAELERTVLDAFKRDHPTLIEVPA